MFNYILVYVIDYNKQLYWKRDKDNTDWKVLAVPGRTGFSAMSRLGKTRLKHWEQAPNLCESKRIHKMRK